MRVYLRSLQQKTASLDFLTGVLKCGRRLAGKHLKQQAKERQFVVFGWVAEWSKAPVLKTGVRLRVPWVRIPLHPLLLAETLFCRTLLLWDTLLRFSTR